MFFIFSLELCTLEAVLSNKYLNNYKMKSIYVQIAIRIMIVLIVLSGEIRCFYKAFTCNWEPIGKAEVIYTVSAFTGVGIIVGWIDIKDN